MKRKILRFLITFITIFLSAVQSFCADIDFSRYIVSDKAGFLQPIQLLQLNDVLKNLHKETGVDVTLITINSLAPGEKFEDIEKQVRGNYVFGDNDEKWAMVIVTKEPYDMNIRIGKGLRHTIPNTMRRALRLEFLLDKNLITQTRTRYYNGGRRQYRTRFSYNSAARNLYSTVIYIEEAMADENNVRLHTNEIREELAPGIIDYTRAYNIPRTDDFTKFMRRHNLFPAFFVLVVGLWLFGITHYRRRRRRWF